MTALFEPVHNRKNIDIRHSKANVQNDPVNTSVATKVETLKQIASFVKTMFSLSLIMSVGVSKLS